MSESPTEMLRLYLGQFDKRIDNLEGRVRDLDKRVDEKLDEIESQVGEINQTVAKYGEQIKTLFKKNAGVAVASGGTIIAVVEGIRLLLG